jgi:hypothetical protein
MYTLTVDRRNRNAQFECHPKYLYLPFPLVIPFNYAGFSLRFTAVRNNVYLHEWISGIGIVEDNLMSVKQSEISFKHLFNLLDSFSEQLIILWYTQPESVVCIKRLFADFAKFSAHKLRTAAHEQVT